MDDKRGDALTTQDEAENGFLVRAAPFGLTPFVGTNPLVSRGIADLAVVHQSPDAKLRPLLQKLALLPKPLKSLALAAAKSELTSRRLAQRITRSKASLAMQQSLPESLPEPANSTTASSSSQGPSSESQAENDQENQDDQQSA